MIKDDKISRVSEDLVDNHLADGWIFCKKTEWKTKIRDFEKPKVVKKIEKIEKVETIKVVGKLQTVLTPNENKGKMSKYQAKKAIQDIELPKTPELSEEARKILEKGKGTKTVRQQKKETKKLE